MTIKTEPTCNQALHFIKSTGYTEVKEVKYIPRGSK